MPGGGGPRIPAIGGGGPLIPALGGGMPGRCGCIICVGGIPTPRAGPPKPGEGPAECDGTPRPAARPMPGPPALPGTGTLAIPSCKYIHNPIVRIKKSRGRTTTGQPREQSSRQRRPIVRNFFEELMEFL